MNKIFNVFPREIIKLIKNSGVTIDNIETVFTNKKFYIDDCKLDIEDNDVIVRLLPNGKTEQYLVIDSVFTRGTMGIIPDHYQVNVIKIKENIPPYKESSNTNMAKLSFRDKQTMEELFSMDGGYVLNLNNRQFGELIEEYSNIDVYSDPQYIPELSKAKKLRKFWNTESDSVVGQVILELLRIREKTNKSRSKDDSSFTDNLADEAKRIEKIANAMVGNVADTFPTEAERFEADLSAAKSVLQDLIKIGEQLCKNANYNENSGEDKINDSIRDMLNVMGQYEIKDQTRHGISGTGKDVGEVDILITKEGREIALIEGLILGRVHAKSSIHVKLTI